MELQAFLSYEMLVASGVSGTGQWLGQWNMQVEVLLQCTFVTKTGQVCIYPHLSPSLPCSFHLKFEEQGCGVLGDAPQPEAE